MDIEAYLKRINYHGSLAPTTQTLQELQVAHLLAVPFENLSIHAGEPIVLEDDALFEKIVERQRGGFCYELNGLFAALLRGLGFNVAMLSARLVLDTEDGLFSTIGADTEGGYTPDFDHMILMVSLDERWLADVGFGDSFREPLLLDRQNLQIQNGRGYRLTSEGEYLILMERKNGDEWKTQSRFSLQPYQYADYAEMCHYHQTSEESPFRKSRVCTRATPQGRVTLSEMRFIETTMSGDRQERMVTNQEEYTMILREYFGIIMRK